MTEEELFQTLYSNQEFFRTDEGRGVLCDMLIDMGLQKISDRIRNGDSWAIVTYPVDRNFLFLIRKSK